MFYAVFKRQDDIPKRHYRDPTGRKDYGWFCEEVIPETILDKLQRYASPVKTHKQMYIFTHWFDFVRLGKRIQERGHEFEDVMKACDNWKNCEKSVP